MRLMWTYQRLGAFQSNQTVLRSRQILNKGSLSVLESRTSPQSNSIRTKSPLVNVIAPNVTGSRFAGIFSASKTFLPTSSVRGKSSFVKTIANDVTDLSDTGTFSPSSHQQRPSQGYKEDMFGDHRLAYRRKTTWELARALGILWMCSLPGLADNALKIMQLSYRILGQRVTDFLLGRTVYAQFVAGETTDQMLDTITRLRQGGMEPILACPTECFDEALGMPEEEFYDVNLSNVLESIGMAAKLEDPYPMVQYKYTAFMSGDVLVSISPLCKKTIHDPEVIDAFVAAMEGRFVDFAKLLGWESFPMECTEPLKAGLRRVGQINKELQKHDVIALTDAEYVNMNPGLRLLGLCSMKMCNTGHRARVFYTYQAYLKQTVKELAEDVQFAKTSGFTFGVKLVRGAYMVQERQRAKEKGYTDPVNDGFEATTRSYSKCLDVLFEEVALTYAKSTLNRPLTSGARLITASHNEDTVLYALKRLEELKIPKDGGDVFFGQLYGMADHLSFSLGSLGYPIYKSMPYGSLSDTLPYLSRRAQENKAILVNARRERTLIAKMLKDRALLRA